MNYKFIFVIMLSCALYACGDKSTNLSSNANVAVKSINSLDVCKESSKDSNHDCVYNFQVLQDIYQDKRLTTVDNIGLIGYGAVVSIVNSIKFTDKKDLYAIYITQGNRIEADGTLSTCHACSPFLGIGVYQYHNNWKLFASNSGVSASIGSWGHLNLTDKEIDVIPIEPEHFLVTLKTQDGGQGYSSGYLNVIEVRAASGYATNKNDAITSLGNIGISASDCGSGSPKGEDWVSDISFNTKMSPPEITITKKYKKDCKDSYSGQTRTLIYQYNAFKKEYVAN